MAASETFEICPIGWIQSPLKHRREAPRQGNEGGPDAVITVIEAARDCVQGLAAGQEIVLVTWLHQANRAVRKVRPRGSPEHTLTGVFATRSPDRPNPIGLHRVTILEVHDGRLRVAPLEAIDGTPLLDVKPVVFPTGDA